MTRKAIFVDIDNTVVKGATLNVAGKYFLFKRKIGIIFFLRVLYWYLQYKRNKLHKFDQVLFQLTDLTRDWDVASIDAILVKAFNEKIKPRLYVEMISKLRQHHQDGYRIFFVSSTILPIAKLLIDYLGFGEAVTTIPKIVDNHYTSELVGDVCYGPEKIRRLMSIIQKEDIDLAGSYTYTDHISDIPLLELVGHPVVVNPGKKLQRIAWERHWEIMETRLLNK